MTIPIAAAWEIRRLWELPLQIIDGDRSAKYPKRSEFRDSGVLFLNTTNIVNDRLDLSGAVFITEEKFAEIQKGRARRRDILMTTRGSIGKVALFDCEYDEALINAQLLILRADDAQLDSRFLFYAVRSPLFKTHVANFASGAAQPQIPITDLREVEIPIPALPAQRRIARILSAYDDLIENNQRRIRILETMARALYREWFVEFRFPGHERFPRVASPLGDIPQGWEVKKLKDVCHLTMGQSPKSEFYNQIGEGQPFHQGVTDFGDRFPTDRLFCTVEGRVAEAGDILFSVRAPVGRMNIADKRIVLGRGLSATRHNEGHQAFLWEQLRNRFSKDDMMGNGAIFAAVTKGDMQGIELLCPPSALVGAAAKHFEPINSQIGALTKEIQNLRRTRDLLLPRLLSGQVALTDTAA